MKIYFGCTSLKAQKYMPYYRSIRRTIIDDGHTLTRDWLPRLEQRLKNQKFETAHGSAAIYDATIKAVYEANAVIIEDTVSNFSTGHLITLALQRNVPVLVMILKGEKKGYFKESFINGIKSEYLEVVEYDKTNIEQTVTAFLNKYSDHYKRHRFHLVIDDVEKRYLDWANHEYDKSKTKLIREAIRKELDKDKKYGRYLGKK